MSILADFYDLLMPELPGCTTAMVDLHLQAVAREFCLHTSAWRAPLAAVDLVANQAAYALPTPANSELVRVLQLTVGNELLWRDRDGRRYETDCPQYTTDEPPFAMSDDLTTIALIKDEVSTAALVAGLKVTAALKPTVGAATLPDFLKSQYSEAMRYGTLSRLMMMNKKPWTDRGLASEYASMYRSQTNFAAYQGQVGNTRQQLRVKSWG